MTAQDRPFAGLNSIEGLCKRDSKCLRKDGHAGKCWPTAEEN
jgi:hypothetical protein